MSHSPTHSDPLSSPTQLLFPIAGCLFRPWAPRLQLPPPLPVSQDHQPSKSHRMLSLCDLNSHNTTSTGHFPCVWSPLKPHSLSKCEGNSQSNRSPGGLRGVQTSSSGMHRTTFLKVKSKASDAPAGAAAWGNQRTPAWTCQLTHCWPLDIRRIKCTLNHREKQTKGSILGLSTLLLIWDKTFSGKSNSDRYHPSCSYSLWNPEVPP